jgi:N-acetylmuramoyl-L-alanine amidase
MPAGRGVVRSVRLGSQPGRTLRLVLQLDTAVPVRTDYEAAGRQRRLIVVLGRPARIAPAGRAAQSSPSGTDAGPEPEPTRVATAPLHPAHAPANTGRDIIIAIDAGHGGQDPGASGHNGTHEKDVVLAIARALARRVDAEPGMKAYLTRDSDRFVVLRDRIDRARAAHADLFVSVHADSIANRDVTGSSVYVLSERGASSEAARWLAERENAADLKGGVSLADKGGQLASVLMDLSQTASIGSSMEAAERVLSQLDHVGEIRKSQVQQAGFLVLKSPDIPSMLVETAYISNPGEETRLRSAAHQEAVASAIFSGLHDYFRRNPPDGTLFAQQRNRGGGPILAAGTTP